MTSTPQDISKEAIEALKVALTDVTLVERGPLRVVTVSAPHVTGCATAREPGEGTDGGGGRTSACSFALDVKGAWKATGASTDEVDGYYHVARIVNDPEFESGIGPLNVEVASDSASAAGGEAEAAIESARGEIARRVVEAVKSTLASSSPSSPKAAGEGKGEVGSAEAAGEAA